MFHERLPCARREFKISSKINWRCCTLRYTSVDSSYTLSSPELYYYIRINAMSWIFKYVDILKCTVPMNIAVFLLMLCEGTYLSNNNFSENIQKVVIISTHKFEVNLQGSYWPLKPGIVREFEIVWKSQGILFWSGKNYMNSVIRYVCISPLQFSEEFYHYINAISRFL